MTTRRDFIKKTVAGTAALSLGSILPGFGSSRYQDILGANEKIRIGVIGVNSRGKALAQGFAKLPDCEVTYICDVDSRALEKCQMCIRDSIIIFDNQINVINTISEGHVIYSK